jgi:hypothetical protein
MTGRLVAISDLTEAQRSAMLGLLSTHFHGATRDSFEHDLGDKNFCLLIESDTCLLGFSTMHVYETTVDGEMLTVVYSGDTIVDPSAWASAALPRSWITAVYAVRSHFPRGRLVWLLLTSGFRTYRLLPTFWRAFYPRFDASTPQDWQERLTTLAAARFGQRYDPTSGIVRLAHPLPLRPHLVDVPANRLADPHVRFFLERNPGHAHGDELVSIADLSPENLTPVGRRVAFGAAR